MFRSDRGQVRFEQPAPVEPPELLNDVPRIFCDGQVTSRDLRDVDVHRLFAEVDGQLAGKCRLAGGRVQNLAAVPVETLNDAEDQHAYHRLYWIARYATAAFFGHQGAERELIAGFEGWTNSEWETSLIARWPYTVAERIASLTTALFWIESNKGVSLATLIVPMKRQIWCDAVGLSSSIEYNLGVHNHLLNDARALFLAGTVLSECQESAEWRERSFAIWDEYFPALVLEDGTFAEQSSHYHLLLSRTALEYALACKRNKRPVARGFEARLEAMFELSNVLVRHDGSLPRFGDNSPDATACDLSGLLAAAYFHGFLKSTPRHKAITPLTIFYCGTPPQIRAENGHASRHLFPKGGFVMLRSASLDAELVAHGDERGSAGTHGDTGSGSYELWWKGNILVREPGSFFNPADARSAFYHSAQGQNVTTIDALSPALTKEDARFLARWYWPQGGTWKESSCSQATYECGAFSRLDDSLSLTRQWRFEGSDKLIFEETIEGNKAIVFESRVCLGDATWKVSEESYNKGIWCFGWNSEDGSSAWMTVSVPKAVNVRLQPCKFLPEYGVEKDGRSLVLGGFLQLPFSWSIEWRFVPEGALCPDLKEN